MLYLNGKQLPLSPKEESGSTPVLLTDFLNEHQFSIEKIAVELNGEILPKASYDKTMLKDGDHLEVVQFVGGG